MKNSVALLFLFILCSSCEPKKSPIEIEKEVFGEIFAEVLDSIYMDRRLFLQFPPAPKMVFDKNGNFIKEDTTDLSLKKKIFKKQIKAIQSDTLDIKIAVNPTLTPIKKTDQTIFNTIFKNKTILFSDTLQNITIDINTLKHTKLDKIISTQQFPRFEINEIFSKNSSLKITGIYTFSRIYFNESYNYGILEAGYYCGGKCGEGYLIYIKKIKNLWRVYKTEPTWIS